METKPNWLVRHINLITAAVALYPWLLMILLLWDNQRYHQHGYAALGAAIAILFLLALTSGMNVLISSLVIFVARCSTPPLASGGVEQRATKITSEEMRTFMPDVRASRNNIAMAAPSAA